MKFSTWYRVLACMVLLLLCPLPVLAVQENQVVVLPTAVPVASFPLPTENPYTIERMAGYYGSEPALSDEGLCQYPSLRPSEKERAVRLLEEYQKGTRPQKSVLNATENVVVGVYGLRPEDYEGQTVYVLLPAKVLTDDELLAIIDAYAQLGQVFDPNGLSLQNCARGGGLECTRFYAEEERDRRGRLSDLYKRQGIRPQGEATRIPGDDGVGVIQLNVDEYCGMDSFHFLPYRAQTDEELLRVIALEMPDEEMVADVSQMVAYESETRMELIRVFGVPASLTRDGDSLAKASDFDVGLSDQAVYQCSLSMLSSDGLLFDAWSLLNLDTHKLEKAFYYHYPKEDAPYTDVMGDPYDAKWETLTRETVERMRGDDVKIRQILPEGERGLINSHGFGVSMKVLMEDGSGYSFLFRYSDSFLEQAEYYAQQPKPQEYVNK